MPVLNPNFDDPGTSAGQAEHWVLEASVAGTVYAGFGSDNEAMESFEHDWQGNEAFVFAWSQVTSARALFGSLADSTESFKRGWQGNEAFVWGLTLGVNTTAPFSASFDAGWANNEFFVFTFDELSTTTLVDDFETGWRQNESFFFHFDEVSSVAASFDNEGTPEAFEDFEEDWSSLVMVTV